MIEIKEVSKSFEGRLVLDAISGVFYQKKTNLIIGGSGTGKSVLLKCILGLFIPEKGEILYDGQNFIKSSLEIQKEIRRQMGVLFQGSALFDSKTVVQNVQFPLDMFGNQSASENKERAMLCLRRVGLENAATRMPSEISGGMKKRVGIARAIVMNPKYLFCDEPNSGLDPLTSIKIDQLIAELTEEFNITTVIITHDMNSVLEIGDTIMFLYQGKKLWDGNRETILQSDRKELKEFLGANKLLREHK